MTTGVDLESVGCSEYTIAGQLLACFVAALEVTRAGAPDMAVVHPGDMVPDYGACGLAWTRVVQVSPVPSKNVCVDQQSVTVELGVSRCYGASDPKTVPAPAVLDSAARDLADDAQAMRAAVLGFRELTGIRAVLGVWRPRGPKGGIHGGTLQVTVAVELGLVGPDELAPPLPGDPRE